MTINWRYTIGEILIVIIGISIAFMLNSWKEERENNQRKNQYLENLAIDIEEEVGHLEENTKKINHKLSLISELRPFLGNQTPRRDTVIPKFFQLADLVDFYPEQTTYQTMVNSGDMRLIDNFELRRKLEEHLEIQNRVLKSYQRIENIGEKYIADYFIYSLNFNEIFRGDSSFLDDPLLVNIISSLDGAYRIVLTEQNSCIDYNLELLELIRSHYNN